MVKLFLVMIYFNTCKVLYGSFHYFWPMFGVFVTIIWQTGCCDVNFQIIRAYVVGIAPFQILKFLFNMELFDFEVCELVCCML